MKQIELSVLMTQDDYAAFLVQKRRMQRGRRFQTALYVGELLVVAAAAGLFFGDRIGMSAASAVCLLAAGIALIAYDYVIAPWLDRLTAVRDYAEKENLRTACLYRFTAEAVYLRGGRTEGTLPFAFLTEWDADAGLFHPLLWTGNSHVHPETVAFTRGVQPAGKLAAGLK